MPAEQSTNVGSRQDVAKVATARRAAFDVLGRVVRGGYASELLIERTAALDPRDAGLAAEITLGTLRRQGQVDQVIERISGRPVSKLDPEVQTILRMGAYQVRFLDRIPPYAAVNDSLALVRFAKKTSAVGFVNAVLRKIAADTQPISEDAAVPHWLREKWTRDFGSSSADAIAKASLHTPPLYQHIPPGSPPPDGARPSDIPGCWQVETADPRYRVQDIGSQSVVPLLAVEEDRSFLDLCAAPGNKTAQALELTRRVTAADISLKRLHVVRTLPARLVVLDAIQQLPFSVRFDRILVDAPCSGTGTLAHNPEIKWRLQPEDLPRFAQRQERILENALDVLAPGGVLVYSTCSLEPEENEAVARKIARTRIEREVRRMPGRDPGDGFYAAVIR